MYILLYILLKPLKCSWSSRLWIRNTSTASLQRGKTPPKSVLVDDTKQRWCFSHEKKMKIKEIYSRKCVIKVWFLGFFVLVIYKALCFDVAQGRMNGAPNVGFFVLWHNNLQHLLLELYHWKRHELTDPTRYVLDSITTVLQGML